MDSPQFIPAKKEPEFIQVAREAILSQAGQRKTRNIEETKALINVTHEDAWLNINKKVNRIQEESKLEDDVPYEAPATEFKIKIEEQQPNDTLSNNEDEIDQFERDNYYDKPEIDIVDEELQQIEFESAGKTTHLGSSVVPPIQLHKLPINKNKRVSQN